MFIVFIGSIIVFVTIKRTKRGNETIIVSYYKIKKTFLESLKRLIDFNN